MYGAGSYSYSTTTPPENDRATGGPVEVPYAPGLGYSVTATANANQPTGTLATPSGDGSANYLEVTGSTLNDNTAIQVPTSTGAANTDTITISGTRPMSVWYTVGASAPANSTNNIYIPTENKLVGTNTAAQGGNNDGKGGIG